MAELDAALDTAANREEAIAWLQFDAAVFEHLQSSPEGVPDRSRERLLAKGILREKHQVVTRKAPAHAKSMYRLAPIALILQKKSKE